MFERIGISGPPDSGNCCVALSATESNRRSPIERRSQCHHVVTHNVAKLTEHLFVAGTTVPGLASNYSTLEPLNVHNVDHLSARDALRVDRRDMGRSRVLADDPNYLVVTEE
jgi:hypothetical protein